MRTVNEKKCNSVADALLGTADGRRYMRRYSPLITREAEAKIREVAELQGVEINLEFLISQKNGWWFMPVIENGVASTMHGWVIHERTQDIVRVVVCPRCLSCTDSCLLCGEFITDERGCRFCAPATHLTCCVNGEKQKKK